MAKWAEAGIELHAGEAVIVIRVPTSVLQDALHQNPRDDSYYDVQVTNLAEFAADVVRELNSEVEDGTTPVHSLFDAAMANAIDNGSMGCEFTERSKTPKAARKRNG